MRVSPSWADGAAERRDKAASHAPSFFCVEFILSHYMNYARKKKHRADSLRRDAFCFVFEPPRVGELCGRTMWGYRSGGGGGGHGFGGQASDNWRYLTVRLCIIIVEHPVFRRAAARSL